MLAAHDLLRAPSRIRAGTRRLRRTLLVRRAIGAGVRHPGIGPEPPRFEDAAAHPARAALVRRARIELASTD